VIGERRGILESWNGGKLESKKTGDRVTGVHWVAETEKKSCKSYKLCHNKYFITLFGGRAGGKKDELVRMRVSFRRDNRK
jgi:hypothetical protein